MVPENYRNQFRKLLEWDRLSIWLHGIGREAVRNSEKKLNVQQEEHFAFTVPDCLFYTPTATVPLCGRRAIKDIPLFSDEHLLNDLSWLKRSTEVGNSQTTVTYSCDSAGLLTDNSKVLYEI